jgi:hypothetical protein
MNIEQFSYRSLVLIIVTSFVFGKYLLNDVLIITKGEGLFSKFIYIAICCYLVLFTL